MQTTIISPQEINNLYSTVSKKNIECTNNDIITHKKTPSSFDITGKLYQIFNLNDIKITPNQKLKGKIFPNSFCEAYIVLIFKTK